MRGALIAGGVALVLAAGIFLLRPGAMPPPKEADVMASLGRAVLAPMGDVVVVSEPSDCRSEGVAKASLPAALFRSFLEANAASAQALDLAEIAAAPPSEYANLAPEVMAGAVGKPVVAVSRAGMLEAQALVCIEVFAAVDRAFFVVLARGHERPWSVQRELLAWESERPVATSVSDDEPLFLPRPSELDRALREQ